MQFNDLKKQYQPLGDDLINSIAAVIAEARFILGEEVNALEYELQQYTGSKHCIGVSSGTDALIAALLALDIKPGDQIITSPFTFIANLEAITLLGAIPVFIDIEPDTYNLSVDLIEQKITKKTKAIIAINIFGQCAQYDQLEKIAKHYNLYLIEDAAQSFGAEYKGKKSCSFGTISCTSFFPSKPLGCYGDGGACFTNNDDLANKLCMIRNHGQSQRYCHSILGLNARLDNIQAVVLLAKLKIFPNELILRQQRAGNYSQALSAVVKTPTVLSTNKSVFAQYTIEVEQRDNFCQRLSELDIPNVVHYPLPLYRQAVYLNSNQPVNIADFPVCEHVCRRVVSLPFHPYLSDEQQNRVIAAVQQAV